MERVLALRMYPSWSLLHQLF